MEDESTGPSAKQKFWETEKDDSTNDNEDEIITLAAMEMKLNQKL